MTKSTIDDSPSLEEQARKCNRCGKPTIITYNHTTYEANTYDLDDNYPYIKIKHRHSADDTTIVNVVDDITIEKKLAFEKGPGDYDPVAGIILN